MTEFNHDRKQEELRIQKVLIEINNKITKLNQDSGGLKSDVIQLRKTFWDDVTVNIDNPEEAVETLASIKQQSEMLSERERTHQQIHKQLKTLMRLQDSPYFGRVDFWENGETNKDVVYLGIASLMDENEEDFLIYDWRAPISSIYYDYSPGPAQYETMDGIIQGEMDLKRQFITKNGEIQSMFDTGVTIGDELLKEVLGNNANTQMKNIVATIQKEQNQIIRNENSKYLIVQGVAGSGKTSAALQRVAYLLYRHLNELRAENIMLFSPNPLFNSYVATVLPDLGEDNMQQATYQEYVEKRIHGEFKVEGPFEQMEYVLTQQNEPSFNDRMQGIQYKASLDFKVLIDDYLDFLSKQQLIFKTIRFRGETLITRKQIAEYFYSLDSTMSISNRMEEVKKWLLKEVKKKEKIERTKEWAIEEAELMENEQFINAYQELQSKGAYSENTFNDFDQEQMLLAKQVVQKHFKPIILAIKQLKFIHFRAIYQQLFDLQRGMSLINVPVNWQEICRYTLEKIRKRELYYEDTTPYLYLKEQIEGSSMNTMIRHLFIDEAQDYSPFQFAVLKQWFPYCKMTILGDFNQAIFAHTLNAPSLLSSDIFHDGKQENMILTKSYRSTRQIIEFTKHIILGGEIIEAFNRNGKKPTYIEVENEEMLQLQLVQLLKQLQESNYQTIAVICKTNAESMRAYEALVNEINIQFMSQTTYTFTKGILVLPAYLAKGIEFDAVIIYDASQYSNESSVERKLFYTACTRAMHELHVFASGEKTPFMKRIPMLAYDSNQI
ncbi:RNA polymerase recycling motor HelD [Bacillus massiliigorillae]|uniref:RNA polymerase recycling motor HelD n=1 Tax=Bacillus massiliigorillae TaxID=1243664 RepID=UPI00039B416C|nr:RNA polymerase recycling motor HelD [Bacillus massiliigorillae]